MIIFFRILTVSTGYNRTYSIRQPIRNTLLICLVIDNYQYVVTSTGQS